MNESLEKVRDHFRNPRNLGEVANPDGTGQIEYPYPGGDMMRVTFKLDAGKRIAEIKFRVFACAGGIALMSALTEIVKGMTTEEAANVTNEDVTGYLDLPREKGHGAVIGRAALAAAIHDYRTKASAAKSSAETKENELTAQREEMRTELNG